MKRQGMNLRAEMLDEIDEVHLETDGETPDHLIVSDEVWEDFRLRSRFEELKDTSNPKRPGYLGMKVWHSSSLDKRGKVGLLLSEQAFQAIVPRVRDHRKP
jgi:predicted HTH transcriptional regulator